MKQTGYLLSIGLVTRNGPDRLIRVLESIKSQSFQPFEIIISDDSDQKDLIRSNQEIAHKYGCRYINGPQKGLYANRNFVARHIIGTHLRTMDDDHTFPENHLEICMNAIEKEPETIWTIGEYLSGQEEGTPPHPIAGQLHPRGYSYVPQDLKNYCGISCGGTIFPFNVIKNNDLNIEVFQFGKVYLEYGLRLKSLGYTIRPLTETYILHHNTKTFASEITNSIIKEARLYSMIKLAFVYDKTLINKFKVLSQVLYEMMTNKISFWNIKNVCKILKNESFL